MLKSLIFLLKYKILKDPTNLSYQTKEFFELPKKAQRKVLDKYFKKLDPAFNIANYFDTKESRYYFNNKEITFFDCYYFDKKIIEHNITNIKLIDKFNIENNKVDYLIEYALELIKEDNLIINVDEIINYKDNLPSRLSRNIKFMKYLININYYNVKYLEYNETTPQSSRELIQEAITLAIQKEYNLNKFLKNDKTLPKILATNINFIIYLIQNDINNVKYLNEKLLESQTVTTKKEIITTIIATIKDNNPNVSIVEENPSLANILNKDETFIIHILNLDINNISYIDWHNLNDLVTTQIINYLTKMLIEKNQNLDIVKYPFKDIFYQNYSFMNYLVEQDYRWLAATKINAKEDNDKLIDLFFQKINPDKYRFNLQDFLEDGEYLNHRLVENKKMLHFFFENNVKLIKYINFFNLQDQKAVVENILKELENKDYVFVNEDFLINNKYPIPLSNSYRFMRYVIDKNFNNLAFIDISMIDKRELKRIINYAFRMVYYIRGNNKKLNFDFEGYFKNSTIIDDEYFQECLKSL